jgi:predicted YcjX-like family ATPase
MTDGLPLYERDLVRWSEEQAHALRAAKESRTNLPIDWDNLAEEIDGLGRALRAELRNRLATVLEHLYKLRLSGADDPRAGWMETVMRERVEIESLLEDNPSLRSSLASVLEAADHKVRKLAQISLTRHGEWSADTSRTLETGALLRSGRSGPLAPGEPGADRP